jgi:hypothetical protein
MTTLTTLRDRVEQVLADSGNAIWSTSDLDEAIRQALNEYSLVSPYQAEATLTLSDSDREIDVSALTSVIGVSEVWAPYDAGSPTPIRRAFEHWRDWQSLYIKDHWALAAGDVARIFYTQLHTLSGLDSATVTTLRAEEVALIITGAAGHAATSRALDLAEQVTLDRATVKQVRAWGQDKLREFRAGLSAIARRQAGVSHVPAPALDRWDGGWS